MSGQDDQSEEKTLPATPRKLSEARKKGQVSSSKDMVSSIGAVGAMIYLFLRAPDVIASLQQAFLVTQEGYRLPFLLAAQAVGRTLMQVAIGLILPLIVIVVLLAVITNITVLRGPVFAIEPILPKLEHINPIAGFKKLFSLRNLIEFTKVVIKVALLAALLGVTILLSLNTVLRTPDCAAACLGPALTMMLLPVLAVTAVLYLFSGMLDIGLQRWLFLRDMRMTRTESKREQKDMQGDPLIRRERRRLQREIALGEEKTGARHVTVLVLEGTRSAYGVRFVRGETIAPMIAARASGADAVVNLRDTVIAYGGAVVADDELARALGQYRIGPGDYVPQQLFQRTAAALRRAGAL